MLYKNKNKVDGKLCATEKLNKNVTISTVDSSYFCNIDSNRESRINN